MPRIKVEVYDTVDGDWIEDEVFAVYDNFITSTDNIRITLLHDYRLMRNIYSGEVFLYDQDAHLLTGFDGLSFGIMPKVVGDTAFWEEISVKHVIPDYLQWRKAPGEYSDAHFVRCTIVLKQANFPTTHKLEPYSWGGNIVALIGYIEDYDVYSIENEILLNSRQEAHQGADCQW